MRNISQPCAVKYVCSLSLRSFQSLCAAGAHESGIIRKIRGSRTFVEMSRTHTNETLLRALLATRLHTHTRDKGNAPGRGIVITLGRTTSLRALLLAHTHKRTRDKSHAPDRGIILALGCTEFRHMHCLDEIVLRTHTCTNNGTRTYRDQTHERATRFRRML